MTANNFCTQFTFRLCFFEIFIQMKLYCLAILITAHFRLLIAYPTDKLTDNCISSGKTQDDIIVVSLQNSWHEMSLTFLLLFLLPREVKKAVFVIFTWLVLSTTIWNTILIHINDKSPSVCHNTQVLQQHRPGYNPLLYIQQQEQQHLWQSETNTSYELTSDGVTISPYSPEMNTSIAKANTSKSTCQVHVGSCFTVFRVSDGSVHHGGKWYQWIHKQIGDSGGKRERGLLYGERHKKSKR